MDFVVGTFSKSLGSIGGYCVSNHAELEAIRFSIRSYIFTASSSPVVAVRIEDRETALRWWPQLLEQGIYVNLVVPPASPSAFSLLRCSVSAAHSEEQIDRMIRAFATLRAGA